jgi:hypothetical protein
VAVQVVAQTALLVLLLRAKTLFSERAEVLLGVLTQTAERTKMAALVENPVTLLVALVASLAAR